MTLDNARTIAALLGATVLVLGCSSKPERRSKDAAPVVSRDAPAAREDVADLDEDRELVAAAEGWIAVLEQRVRADPLGTRELLEAELRNPLAVVRAAAVNLVAETAHPRAIQLLEPMTKDAKLRVRLSIADALYRLGTPESIELQLSWGATSPDDEIRHASLARLADRKDARVIPPIERELTRDDLDPRLRGDLELSLRELR